MRTLILFATKHGAAKEIAHHIAKKIDGSVVHNLKQGDAPSIEQFDCIIIGSSVYAGSILKEVKAFIAQNTDTLRKKPLGLFLSGLDAKQEQTYFKNNFSPDILQTAKAMSFLGGVFDPKKTGIMERLIMKLVAKQSEYTNTINDGQIKQFVEVIKA